MSSEAGLIAFPSRARMAGAVADLVGLAIARAVAAYGRAEIAVSGGSTPAGLYRELAGRALAWEDVGVTLVDERWTPPGSAGSNETFVVETLLQHHAAAAAMTGLYGDGLSPAEAAPLIDRALADRARPFDAVILGMGNDGHTASWFPDAEGLSAAIDPLGAVRVAAIRARRSAVTGDHLDRLTLTLPAIAEAGIICLLIAGDDKRAAFEEAIGEGPVEAAPVRALLRRRPDTWVCWAA